MRMDQLNGLLALKAVAETRSFTVAASRLGVSASAVSQTIKALEQRLGVALLARTTRSTSLTEVGRRFLDRAGPAIDQILGALEEAESDGKAATGLLRLNLPRHVYSLHLAPLITSFTAKHPEITVELFFEDHRSDVVGQGFDAGIRLSDILAQDVAVIKLTGPIRFVTAAAPAYLDRHGRPDHPRDLLAHNCLCPRLDTRLYDQWEFEHKGKEFKVAVKGTLIMNDPSLMEIAAVRGDGIIYIPEQAAQKRVESGELEIVLPAYASVSAGFFLYYPKPSQALPKLRAFIEHVKDERRAAGG